MRDSTWYPVGPTNECFLLSKRDSSNGVQLASNIVGDQYRPECQENPEVERGISPTDVKVDVDATSPIATISQGGQALETFKTPESQPVNLTERAKVTVGAPARARFYGGAGGVEGGSIMDFIRQENSESGDFARPLPHRIFLLLSEAQRREALAAEAALSMEARAIDDLRLPSVTYTLKRQSPPRGVIGAGREGAIGESMPLTTVTPAATPAATPAPAGVHGEGSPVRPASTDVVGLMCHEDPWTDMFQLGRMEGPENDFVVRGPLHQSGPGNKVCGPVSRYAVRLLVDRDPPHRCRIFTGGFNSRCACGAPEMIVFFEFLKYRNHPLLCACYDYCPSRPTALPRLTVVKNTDFYYNASSWRIMVGFSQTFSLRRAQSDSREPMDKTTTTTSTSYCYYCF